ncbi:fatty acid--CoA ligase family protein [Bacillus sp. RG28]|uniref:Fatty acid--CoA ligase family protein n=1 Tax=Gottfriedia endophytica TaxID=2820819 RepID=A0A940SJ51_9BACI|nr:fatty acid--CoA ligase family protein [Gottfriedia endophytica]MBP0724534.1 fatty acid--CoA ligase family protein [Gottfriedia endophytica]
MNLVQKLSETAMNHPEDIAVFFEGQQITYKTLDSLITRFACGLSKLGIQKGDNVALVVGNSPHFIISLYGALKVGASVIPINPLYTPDELLYILTNGDAKAVITLDLLLPLVEKASQVLTKVEHYIICETKQGEEPVLSGEKLKTFTTIIGLGDTTFGQPEIHEDDIAVILYTSGTTGKPKGAMLTHKNMYSNAIDTSRFLSISSKDRVIATLPMFHVFCLTVALNAPLMAGGSVIVVPRFSPKEIFHITKELGATVFAGVPTMYNFMYQYPDGQPEDLKTFRICISGGSSLPVALLENFERKFNVQVSEGYGLSEAAPVTCFNPLDKRKAGSIGKNINNVINKVVNELGEEVPVGEVGELIVKGPNVMKGYYKMPEDTAKTLRDGWLYTGDLARMDEDGYFFIVDRKKEMILVGGYNVYPREVEEVIYNHSDVVEVAVIGVPDENLGESVKAYVVSKNPSLSEEELIEYCKIHLAKYKVPSSIEFIEELPKNSTGKILRRALKEELQTK